MIDCAEFLAHHSDLRDGAGMPAWVHALERHRATCSSCAHYDRVVRDGVDVARALPEMELSADFGARLQHRLFHVEDEMARARARRPMRAALGSAAFVAVVAGIAWGPLPRRAAAVRLPAVAAAPPPSIARSARRHLAAQLADLGVPVVNTPYRDLIFRESPLSARIAEYAVDVPAGR